eukprot:3622794-Pyramimonas_sp.AAC.1
MRCSVSEALPPFCSPSLHFHGRACQGCICPLCLALRRPVCRVLAPLCDAPLSVGGCRFGAA